MIPLWTYQLLLLIAIYGLGFITGRADLTWPDKPVTIPTARALRRELRAGTIRRVG